MTNEEAIKTLHELWRTTNDPWYEKVYEMAINALKAQELSNDSPELDNNFGDLIRRQEAIDALKHDAKVLGIEPYDQGYTPFDAIITIHGIPNAQPEKHTEERTETHGVCLDAISRHDALDICDHAIDLFKGQFGAGVLVAIKESIEELPSAEPKIIYCKDCRKHNKKVGFDENFHTVWKEDACPLASWRGKAQGHEFDYQFCAFAERRT